MAVKHGNWNAYQKTEAEVQKEAMDARAAKIGTIVATARNMYEMLMSADLTADGRAAALDVLNTLVRRLSEKT